MMLKFLKEYRLWLGLYLAMACLFLLTFALYRLPLDYFANTLLFVGTLFLLGLVLAFIRFVKKWQSLKEWTGNESQNYLEDPLMQITYEALERRERIFNERYTLLQNELTQTKSLIKMWGHQIKVPLASLDLLVQTDHLNPQQVASQIQSIDHYLTILLTYLKFKDKADDFRFERLSVRPLMSHLIKQYRIQCLSKDLSVTLEGDWQLNSDAKWLSFALSQVLDNAIKYSKVSGSIRIQMTPTAILITDQGIGILPEDVPRLFEEGFTGFNGHQYHKSTGLGLYMAKMVLDSLGLHIVVESQIDQGTTVTISSKKGNYE